MACQKSARFRSLRKENIECTRMAAKTIIIRLNGANANTSTALTDLTIPGQEAEDSMIPTMGRRVFSAITAMAQAIPGTLIFFKPST